MSIISKYIVRQHIGPFFFGFSIISLVFILNLLFRELNRILSKGLPLEVVGEFFLLNMGWIVALAVPMATLTASLMTFGRMSADNEITAFKASGVSLYRLVAPALITASLLAVFLIWFNNKVLPESNHRLALLIRDISRKKPTINIEPGVWYDELSNYGLMVTSLRDSDHVSIAHNVLINDHSQYDVTTIISAEKGYIRVNQKEGLLELLLFNGEMQEINIKKPEEFRKLRFPRHIVRIDITDRFLKRSNSSSRGDREKSAAVMRKEIAQNRAQIKEKKKIIASLIGWQFNRYFGSSFGLPVP
ncbi:MAG: YjgP/YjgQ family permease, partial [Calditrichaeota bacterium]